jgi:hypothetical protein
MTKYSSYFLVSIAVRSTYLQDFHTVVNLANARASRALVDIPNINGIAHWDHELLLTANALTETSSKPPII